MSKPRWSWQWIALNFWNLAGKRRRGKKRFRRTRTIRMEPLNPRIVLAADVISEDEVVALEPVPAEEATVPATTIEAPEANTETLSIVTSEVASAITTVAASHYDVNGDGSVSPIDVLLLINQSNEVAGSADAMA